MDHHPKTSFVPPLHFPVDVRLMHYCFLSCLVIGVRFRELAL